MTQQELFDDLYTRVRPEDYTATLQALADKATEKTADIGKLSEAAHWAYCKARRHFDEQWKREWVAARDELLGRDDD